ncbi:ABC transporter permease [Shewanella intestini]|uniref:Transport permease protein n=1 Tax=Shewanella intestini TaxID=2017544 RepID=A0ABS5I552_9GAMM|nr:MULTISPECIES: ABC transporter permease [Shewanella]MBR9729151.1 ABC transporter permease [Shewanella intestini]MRG37278.1 ABC transporter permease [Shewanella sp. XMDDZSB0408]
MNPLYLIAFKSILTKEITRFSRIWVQTIVPPAITMTLYFLIFGNLVGSRIGQMGGVSYMEFIAPGLIMMSVITNSFSNVASSFYSAKFQRNLEEIMVAPVPHYVMIAGYVGGGVTRGLIVGCIVTIVAMCFVDISIHHLGLVLLTALLTSMMFALAGLINAVFAKSYDDISIIPTFVLTPLTYLGGVFYSLSLLPDFWQGVSALNPVVYVINVFRYGFLGYSDMSVPLSLAIIIGFCAGLWFVAYYLISRGIGLRS